MSIIPKTKFGDCANSECGAKETEVVKVGKELFCLYCRQSQKAKIQVIKANERNKVRSLGFKQKLDGKEDAASRSAIIQDIDWTFSRILRLMAADQWGNVQCYTCPTKKNFGMMQCGHYISRSNMGLRWSFDNCRPQCPNCNEALRGNLSVFSERLDSEVAGTSEMLLNQSREPHNYGISELKELLLDFRAKLKPLEAKFSKPKNHIADTGKIGVNKIK